MDRPTEHLDLVGRWEILGGMTTTYLQISSDVLGNLVTSAGVREGQLVGASGILAPSACRNLVELGRLTEDAYWAGVFIAEILLSASKAGVALAMDSVWERNDFPGLSESKKFQDEVRRSAEAYAGAKL